MSEPLGISARDAVRLRNLLIAFEQGRLNTALPGGQGAPAKGQDVFLGYISSSIAAGATGTAVMCSVDGTPTITQLSDLPNVFTVLNPGSSSIPAGYIAMVREPTYGYWLALPFGSGSAGGGMTNPMTTLGDIIYENATPAPARLAGNTSTTKKFLTQTGTGSASAAPTWGTLSNADFPSSGVTSGTYTLSTVTVNSQGIVTAAASGPPIGTTLSASLGADTTVGLPTDLLSVTISATGTYLVSYDVAAKLAMGGTAGPAGIQCWILSPSSTIILPSYTLPVNSDSLAASATLYGSASMVWTMTFITTGTLKLRGQATDSTSGVTHTILGTSPSVGYTRLQAVRIA